jgi:hypothetical protein
MLRSAILLTIMLIPALALGSHGIVTVQSNHSVSITADRLEPLLKEKGMTIFSRIDHAAGAAGIGETLRPTILFIFGNPTAGTALMKCGQTAGYNDPRYIADRHGISDCGQILEKMAGALKVFAEKAAGE